MRTALRTALASVSLAMFACGGAEWRVIKQASPNPLAGHASFAVLPVDYAGLKIGTMTEADYVASKSDETKESFEGDKDAISEKFAAALVARANEQGLAVELASGRVAAPFLIRPHVDFIEPGSPLMGLGPNSEVHMRVVIETAEGKRLDVIELRHETPASSWATVSSGQRVREDAAAIGEALAEYLVRRTDG